MVQWIRLCAPNAGGKTSISGKGTKIPSCCMDKRNKKLLALSSPDQRWESQTIHGGKKKKKT